MKKLSQILIAAGVGVLATTAIMATNSAEAASLGCPKGLAEVTRGSGIGNDQSFVLCINETTGVFEGFKMRKGNLVAGISTKDPAAALAGVPGLALPNTSGQYKVALAAGQKRQQQWRLSEYGDIATDKAKQDMQDKIDNASNVLAIGNTVVKLGSGGNTQCAWSNPDATKVVANAGVYECGPVKFCQRAVKCTMTVEGQSFSFESTAKCAIGAHKIDGTKITDQIVDATGLKAADGCGQDPNTCAAQNFNGQQGFNLPDYDPSKQTGTTTGAQ